MTGHGRRAEVDLDDFSLRFRDALLGAYPELATSIDAGTKPGSFAVRLEAPSGAELWVTTDEEVTVGFGAFHAHFEIYQWGSEEETFARAIEFMGQLMRGEREIATWRTSEGRWAGSTVIEPGEQPHRLSKREDDVVEITRWTG